MKKRVSKFLFKIQSKLIVCPKVPSELSWYYGYAYSDYRWSKRYYAIIPLNLILKYYFGFWYFMKGVKPSVWDKKLQDAFNTGFMEGVSSRAMMTHVAKELSNICGIDSEITISDLRE